MNDGLINTVQITFIFIDFRVLSANVTFISLVYAFDAPYISIK